MVTDPEYQKLFEAALTWTNGNADRARDLVESWHRGALQAENAQQADYAHEAGEHRNQYVEHCPQCTGRATT